MVSWIIDSSDVEINIVWEKSGCDDQQNAEIVNRRGQKTVKNVVVSFSHTDGGIHFGVNEIPNQKQSYRPPHHQMMKPNPPITFHRDFDRDNEDDTGINNETYRIKPHLSSITVHYVVMVNPQYQKANHDAMKDPIYHPKNKFSVI